MRVICFGDSISAANDAWPTLVAAETVVLACVGAKVRDVLNSQYAEGTYDLATITVGVNDVLDYTQPLPTVDEVQKLADRALQAASRVIMFSLPDRQCRMPGNSEHSRLLARRREEMNMTLRQAEGVIFTDLNMWMDSWRCWQPDRIHPTRYGSQQIARALGPHVGLRGTVPKPRYGLLIAQAASNLRYRARTVRKFEGLGDLTPTG